MLDAKDVESPSAALSFTVNLTDLVTVLFPLFAETVIVTSPAFTPVTTPLELTVATALLLDLYVTLAVEGLTVVFNVVLFPTRTCAEVAFTESEGFLTVIVAFKVFFTDLPDFLPVTLTIFFHTVEHNKVDKIRRFQKACGITFVK